MASIVDELKRTVEMSLADLQAELGIFLQQKSRILSLVPSGTREGLLAHQKELEQRGISLVAKASDLSKSLDGFNPWQLSSYQKMGGKSGEAMTMASDLVALKAEMQGHVEKVDKAVGQQTVRPQSVPRTNRNLMLYAGLAALPLGIAVIAYMESRRRR